MVERTGGWGAMEGWTQSAEINLDEVSIITLWTDLVGAFLKLNSHHIGIGILSTNKLFLPKKLHQLQFKDSQKARSSLLDEARHERPGPRMDPGGISNFTNFGRWWNQRQLAKESLQAALEDLHLNGLRTLEVGLARLWVNSVNGNTYINKYSKLEVMENSLVFNRYCKKCTFAIFANDGFYIAMLVLGCLVENFRLWCWSSTHRVRWTKPLK